MPALWGSASSDLEFVGSRSAGRVDGPKAWQDGRDVSLWVIGLTIVNLDITLPNQMSMRQQQLPFRSWWQLAGAATV